MNLTADTITGFCRRLRSREISAADLVRAALESARAHEGTRAFLRLNPQALVEAEEADRRGPPKLGDVRPLHGIPISVKDIFDVAGMETTCGSPFYAAQRKIPRRDSAYVAAWRRTGAIVIGKTHLNEFAYGLTGENLTYGPCLQPRDATLLTGGSSSGAAASVQAGSALIGLGTDTGGSIRVPSALCGLVGFRHSPSARMNRGLFPLAPTFDTCGWLQRSLTDLARVYSALKQSKPPRLPVAQIRLGFLDGEWLNVCEEPIRFAFTQLEEALRPSGATIRRLPGQGFELAPEIFSALQAFEAARIHRKYLAAPELSYDPLIRSRLEWGLGMTGRDHARKRRDLAEHGARLNALWRDFDFLIAPASPFEKLRANEDHAPNRRSLLQLTTPFSLAGLPALAFPWGPGAKKFGWQVLTRRGRDRRLIGLAESLGPFLSPS